MAEVVVDQGGQQAAQGSNSVFGDLQGIVSWIAKYWWVILIVLIVIAGIALLIWFIYNWGLNQKRKDSMFKYYERTVEACKLNARKDFIKKIYRWWFILLGIPTSILLALAYLFVFAGEHWLYLWIWVVIGFLFWLPFVFIFYNDKSMRIVNVDNRTVGYYRGHCRRMDGYVYVLTKIGRSWLILDDNLLLRLPENVLTTKTKLIKNHLTGEMDKKLEFDKIEIDQYSMNERDNYIFIPMTSMVREDTYYYYPTLIQDKKILDERQRIANSYHFITQIDMAEQTYSHLGKVTNNAVDANVGVVAEKKKPEKQRDVNADNGNSS